MAKKFPISAEVTTSLTYCNRCNRNVGKDYGVMPFTLDSTVYCPRCFVHCIAPKMPERFYSDGMSACYCARCKTESVNTGMGVCSNCRWRGVQHLSAYASER